MTLSFINHRGEPVAVAAGGVKKARPAGRKAAAEAYHKGWHVVGFSPAQLAEARAQHERIAPVDGRDRKPFSEALYMRTNAPGKVQTQGKGAKRMSVKTFELHAAAEQCAQMVRRAGWQLVECVPVTKGAQE